MTFCLPYPPDSEGIAPFLRFLTLQDTHTISHYLICSKTLLESIDFTAMIDLQMNWQLSCNRGYSLASYLICGQHVDHGFFVRSRVHQGKKYHFIDSRLDKSLKGLVSTWLRTLSNQSDSVAKNSLSTVAQLVRSAEKKALFFDNMGIRDFLYLDTSSEHSSLDISIAALSKKKKKGWGF